MKIGYARVLTDEQTVAARLHALDAAGCALVFQEQAGGIAKRPELARAQRPHSRRSPYRMAL